MTTDFTAAGSLHDLMLRADGLVTQAAALLAEMQHAPRSVTRKERRDVVTDADLAAERLLIDGLSALTPEAGILSEEAGEAQAGSALRWIIDPLDGTVNYASGLPMFSATVALQRQGRTIMGLTHAPRAGLVARYCWGEAAVIAEVNGAPARTALTRELADAVVSVSLTSSYGEADIGRATEIIRRLAERTRGVRVVVSGALEMSLVAAGQLDAFVALRADVVSHAAAMPLVRAAGGKVTTFAGQDAVDEDMQRIASAPFIHEELLSVIQPALSGTL